MADIYIIFRNDDPGALSNIHKERKVAALFERYKIPQVWAVIPNNVEDPHVWEKGKFHQLEENPEIISLIQEYAGKGLVEVAQHGYTHQTSEFRPGLTDEINGDKFYQGIDRKWAPYDPAHSEGYSEFNGLSVAAQEEKIVKGKEYLEAVLGLEFQSFIFPWNVYNVDCLKLLRKHGFKFIPGEDDEIIVPGICLIGACNWDWQIDEFRKLVSEMETHNKPVLAQFAYHSWEISDEMMAKFEDMFKALSVKHNIHFILPRDIPNVAPWAPSIIRLRCLMLKLARKLEQHLDDNHEIYCPKYYVKDHFFYISKVIKYFSALVFFKILALTRTRKIIDRLRKMVAT